MIFRESSQISRFDSLEDIRERWVERVFVLAAERLTVEKIKAQYGDRKAWGFFEGSPWQAWIVIGEPDDKHIFHVVAQTGAISKSSDHYPLSTPAQDAAEIVIGTIEDIVRKAD